MDCDEEDNSGAPLAPGDERSRSAVNSLILDYYKKFGRKRDLEQFFSLSTAQSDIRDPTSVFWARMKAENESSDSGERSDKKSESSQELCRISIRFPAQDPCTSQEEDSKTKSESVSPPIIIEEIPQDSRQNSDEDIKSEDDALKSDDNNSQKSYDVLLDTSMNKPHSPSSSITSQRKLEWDSLADVGYANESDRKTSASSLSTLERLALKQQYTNNDTQDSNIGIPTSHSTPLDENEAKSKTKKGPGKKTTRFYNKDVDFLELNVPHSSNMNPGQSINVNLTKHISFNVEKDGKVTVENVQKDVNVSPEKVSVETEVSPREQLNKEIQTSLTKAKESTNAAIPVNNQLHAQKIPILISLNTLRSRVRRKKLRMARRKLRNKKRADKENISVQEKSGEQLSEAESFEYMPGHIYNQNQITANSADNRSQATDNKSSLESSGAVTSESSKGSKHSFTKDLEKGIDFLKTALQQRCNDSGLRKQLIKQLCQRLIKSKYRDDDSTTDFLSGLTFSSNKLGLGEKNYTTTSTSDANNSPETSRKPKKSILRTDKFNPGSIASTSQSAPNLPVASNSEKLVTSNLAKNLTTSNTDSDVSSKEKMSLDNLFIKTTSAEIYQKYLQALKREQAYKRHLKDKEMFMKQKLVSSDNAFKVPVRVEMKPSNRLKDLINDLTRNNYDDGSGDASKLEGGPGSNGDFDRFLPNRNQRSHSVFTLSSGNSDGNCKKPNLKKRLQCDILDLSKPGPSKDTHYCCCPHHSRNLKAGVTDSSVQVDIKNLSNDDSCTARQKKRNDIASKDMQKVESPKEATRVITDDDTGDIKYVCLCSKKAIQEAPDNFLIYKCSRLNNKGVKLEETSPKESNIVQIQCNNQNCNKRGTENIPSTSIGLSNKSSQTNMLVKMLHQESANQMFTCSSDEKISNQKGSDRHKVADAIFPKGPITICEATRCIQTEISINPKISDPTLSDINIMCGTDCAKLISEHHRELSKPSLRSQGGSSVESTNSGSLKSTGIPKNFATELENDNQFDAPKKSSQDKTKTREMNIERSDNFTIPIEGTNMALMVKIGSERKVTTNQNIEKKVDQGIATDTIQVVEQATSLTEECSKGVQYDKSPESSNMMDHNSNKIGNNYEIINKILRNSGQSCLINTCLTTDESKFRTYPKTSPVNELKPFRRCNTDTDKVVEMQEIFSTRNVGVVKDVPVETETANRTVNKNDLRENCKRNCKERKSSLNNDRKSDQQSCVSKDLCSCGCEGAKSDCKEDCFESRSSLKTQAVDKEIGTQVDDPSSGLSDLLDDISLKQRDECSCGCGGQKNNCTKNCTELQLSPRKQREIKFVDKKVSTHDFSEQEMQDCKEPKLTPRNTKKLASDKELCGRNDSLDNRSEKCACGCGGTKNNCKNNCRELKSSPRRIRNLSPPNNRTCGKKEFSDDQSEKCLCGCGGSKSNCKKTCKELKSTLRYNRNTSPIKQVCGKRDFTSGKSDLSEKCICGCGGTKSNCKKNCKELKSTPRENKNGSPTRQTPRELLKKQSVDKQISTTEDTSETQRERCSCGCGVTKNNCKNDCSERNITPRGLGLYKKPSELKEVGTQKDLSDKESSESSAVCQIHEEPKRILRSVPTTDDPSAENDEHFKKPAKTVDSRVTDVRPSNNGQKSTSETDTGSDPILTMIQNITKKYSKKEIEKDKRKKCFKEIMTVLNYLLETEDTDGGNEDRGKISESTTTGNETDCSIKQVPEKCTNEKSFKKLVDKEVQPSAKKSKTHASVTESSDLPISTDIPGTSSDSATCKVLNKIKRECERYQKRCKVHGGKKCDTTSTTSMNCDQCRRVHHASCRNNKCKGHKKSNEKIQKNPIAYNLILQTSETMVSDNSVCDAKNRQLKNIIVKVPKKKPTDFVPFREMAAKFEKKMSYAIPCAPNDTRSTRSRSWPNETDISSMEEIMRRSQGATVREYLERNRPDFVDRCSRRQSCMKYISESRANERAAKRDLLSLQVAQLPDVTDLDSDDLRRLAKALGRQMRQKQPAPKLISEREMKMHSEKIYKSLPEVVQRKEDKKKENIKKTNLLMANMFKKNLQKKTLRGSVNLSNYSTVIKI